MSRPWTPAEILARLDGLAARVEGAVLVVAFKSDVAFVVASDAEKADKLTALLDAGGTPVCFLFQRPDGSHLEVAADPLPWVEDRPGIAEYLSWLVEWYRGLLVEAGLAAPATLN